MRGDIVWDVGGVFQIIGKNYGKNLETSKENKLEGGTVFI